MYIHMYSLCYIYKYIYFDPCERSNREVVAVGVRVGIYIYIYSL